MILAELAELLPQEVTVQTPLKPIRFFCPGRLPLWRAETFYSKEPETIEWIDSFEKETVFWDIGANIGVYSLYAALQPNIKVLAFEPAASNFHILNRNIEINHLENKIFSLCIAFNKKTSLDYFYQSNTDLGSALHSFSEATDWEGNDFDYAFKQGMIGFTIDNFIETFAPSFPSYIKIDVDGLEDKILEGAGKTISDPRIKSILVELDTSKPEYCEAVINNLQKAGLSLSSKKHATMFDQGKFSSLYNHIFIR